MGSESNFDAQIAKAAKCLIETEDLEAGEVILATLIELFEKRKQHAGKGSKETKEDNENADQGVKEGTGERLEDAADLTKPVKKRELSKNAEELEGRAGNTAVPGPDVKVHEASDVVAALNDASKGEKKVPEDDALTLGDPLQQDKEIQAFLDRLPDMAYSLPEASEGEGDDGVAAAKGKVPDEEKVDQFLNNLEDADDKHEEVTGPGPVKEEADEEEGADEERTENSAVKLEAKRSSKRKQLRPSRGITKPKSASRRFTLSQATTRRMAGKSLVGASVSILWPDDGERYDALVLGYQARNTLLKVYFWLTGEVSDFPRKQVKFNVVDKIANHEAPVGDRIYVACQGDVYEAFVLDKLEGTYAFRVIFSKTDYTRTVVLEPGQENWGRIGRGETTVRGRRIVSWSC